MIPFWSWHSAVCLLQKGPERPMITESLNQENDAGDSTPANESPHEQYADEHDDYLRTAYPFLVFDERDKYGKLTGWSYLRCIECEAEMIVKDARNGGFVHYGGCPIPKDVDEGEMEHRECSIDMDEVTYA